VTRFGFTQLICRDQPAIDNLHAKDLHAKDTWADQVDRHLIECEIEKPPSAGFAVDPANPDVRRTVRMRSACGDRS
jgi:hypothetical protein